MRDLKLFWKSFLGASVSMLVLAASGFSVTSFIIPPNDAQAQTGKTYAEWSVAWWQHTLEIPLDDNPIFDPTGANCNFAQEGPVFFLAATSGVHATRNECRVPAGKILFFPLLGVANIGEVTEQQPEHASRSALRGFIPATRELQASVDGEDIGVVYLEPDTSPLRTVSPTGFFTLNAPENNVFAGVPGNPYNTVSDGFYLMVSPLPPGPHTITFGATSTYFSACVTYNLYVEP